MGLTNSARSSTIRILKQASIAIVISLLLEGIGKEGWQPAKAIAPPRWVQPSLVTQNLDAQSRLEAAILEEINEVRTNPAAYANRLVQGSGEDLLTIPQKPTGDETVDDAIRFLRKLRPLAELKPSSGLAMAAKDRVIEGSTNTPTSSQQQLSQVNRDGSTNGVDQTGIEEETAQELVTKLILDATVRNRFPIFNPDFQHIGISCQPSAQTCAIIYADDYTEGAQTAAALLFQGALERGDALMPVDSSLYDLYPLEGRAGQTLTVAVESEDFDPVVAVMDAENTIIKQNDDSSDSNSNSSLTVTLTQDGAYYVIVNAYDSQGRGQYTLTVRE